MGGLKGYVFWGLHLFICSSVHLFICSSENRIFRLCSKKLWGGGGGGGGWTSALRALPFPVLLQCKYCIKCVYVFVTFIALAICAEAHLVITWSNQYYYYYYYYYIFILFLLLASETLYTGVDWGYLFIYMWDMWGHTYVICTLILAYFCGSLSVPNFTKQNPLVYQSLPVSF